MRIMLWLALVGALWLALSGCDGGDDGDNTFALAVTVVNEVNRDPQADASVTLLQNGVPGRPAVLTDDEGNVTLTSIPAGTDYVIEVTSPGSAFTRTLVGPLTIDRNRDITVEVLTAEQLSDIYGVAAPQAGTATLVVFAYDAFGPSPTQFEVLVELDAGTPNATGAPAVLSSFAPGTHSVTVIDQDSGNNLELLNLDFPSNAITVLRSAFAQ